MLQQSRRPSFEIEDIDVFFLIFIIIEEATPLEVIQVDIGGHPPIPTGSS
jgi:hypothetical protein